MSSIMNQPKFKSRTRIICIFSLIFAIIVLGYTINYYKWTIREYGIALAKESVLDFKLEADQNSDENVDPSSTVLTKDEKEQLAHFRSQASERRTAIENENNLASLQMFLVPQISCPTAVRAGQTGDGGKWVCNPWLAGSRHPCVIYSFGVNGDTSFERQIYILTKSRCKIFCFDSGAQRADLFDSFRGHFEPWLISGENNLAKNQYTITEIARHFQHKRVEFIKMDIEGSEYAALTEFLISSNITRNATVTCQIFLELHSFVPRWKTLMNLLEKRGFLMFYKEANTYCPSCHEYSYIHRTCLHDYNVQNFVFNRNFN